MYLKGEVDKGQEQEWFYQSIMQVVLFVIWPKSVIP